jgi:hypothetical protein
MGVNSPSDFNVVFRAILILKRELEIFSIRKEYLILYIQWQDLWDSQNYGIE